MRNSRKKCPDCNSLLVDIAGLGNRKEILKCNNSQCPSHFKHINCPKCGSNDKEINILGLGHQNFKCKNCSFEWNSFDKL